jgi:hypothetical protein
MELKPHRYDSIRLQAYMNICKFTVTPVFFFDSVTFVSCPRTSGYTHNINSMSEVCDPRWNAMNGPAPGPGDARIWEDDIDKSTSLTSRRGVIRHVPLHSMDVAGRRMILYKPCSRHYHVLPPEPSKHGQHPFIGEMCGLDTGHASKLYHPLPPAITQQIPSANLGVALENPRAEPRFMDI